MMCSSPCFLGFWTLLRQHLFAGSGAEKKQSETLGMTYTRHFGSRDAQVANLPAQRIISFLFLNLKDLIYINIEQIMNGIGWISRY